MVMWPPLGAAPLSPCQPINLRDRADVSNTMVFKTILIWCLWYRHLTFPRQKWAWCFLMHCWMRSCLSRWDRYRLFQMNFRVNMVRVGEKNGHNGRRMMTSIYEEWELFKSGFCGRRPTNAACSYLAVWLPLVSSWENKTMHSLSSEYLLTCEHSVRPITIMQMNELRIFC